MLLRKQQERHAVFFQAQPGVCCALQYWPPRRGETLFNLLLPFCVKKFNIEQISWRRNCQRNELLSTGAYLLNVTLPVKRPQVSLLAQERQHAIHGIFLLFASLRIFSKAELRVTVWACLCAISCKCKNMFIILVYMKKQILYTFLTLGSRI